MKPTSVFAVLFLLAAGTQALPMHHDKRRFGVEHTPEADATFQEVKDIAQGTDKEAQAGNLSGAMVRALLAKAPACDQQDRADEVIDLGNELGGDKREQLVKVAQTYRQLERNTPNAGQPSELCKKAPRNKELDGLVQAQDPTGKAKDVDNPKGKEADNPKGKEADNPKGKEADNPKGKGKDNPKGKGKDNPKGKGKDNPKGKEADNPKGKEADNPKEVDNPKGKEADNGDTNVAETDPVGGVKMPKIEQENGDFIVNGNGFNGNVDAAHQRQCDIQRNLCFNKFNAGDRTFSTQDCDDQGTACKEGPPVFA